MAKKISRRDILKKGTLVTGAAIINSAFAAPTGTPKPTPKGTPTPTPGKTTTPPPAPTQPPPAPPAPVQGNPAPTAGAQPVISGPNFTVGPSDEIHEVAGGDLSVMTTQQGIPVPDDNNSLRLGTRGPTLMEDFNFREKLTHFDHERMPERVVHPRGYGAHGTFVTNVSLSQFTMADLFQKAGEKTPVFVRFSMVNGSKGSFDLARDVRGFATKFYTRQGNWDLVGNNIPVFFIQDAIKFPDLIHSQKQEPDREFPTAQTAHDNAWDFMSLTPESFHMVMWIMSDRAIPRSFRFMEGFGVHTFRLVNASGQSHYVKFHWKPVLGLQSVVWNEAVKINGADPDFHRRDLWNAISSGNFPAWDMGMQIFDDSFLSKFPFDILDPTKLIPEELLPVQIVGRMTLDRLVENFFEETEQVAFHTANVVPGIDFTDDPLLQGRNFSYLDTQLNRFGTPNFTHLPINQPQQAQVNTFQQDGQMAMRNPVGRVNYEPNSWLRKGDPAESPGAGFKTFAEQMSGQKVRERSETFSDHYSQARQFYISQAPIEQEHIANALIFELSKVMNPEIRSRVVAHLRNIDDVLATTVANGLRIGMPAPAKAAKPTMTNLPPSNALSIVKRNPNTFAGRKLGILVTDGADIAVFNAIKDALGKEGAAFEVIAPEIGGVKASDGSTIPADQKIDGGPSVLYDAVVLVVAAAGLPDLIRRPPSRDFVSDAFAHDKFIGYTKDAVALFEKAGIAPSQLDAGCVPLDNPANAGSFITALRALRYWDRQVKSDVP